LDIQKYEQYEKEAKEHKKEIKQEMVGIESQIEFIQKVDCDIDAESKEIETLENQNDFDLKPKIEELTEQLNQEIKNKNEYNVLVKQNQYIKANRMRIDSEIEKAQSNLDRYSTMESELNIEENLFDETELEKQQEIIDTAKQEISDAKEVVSKLNTEIEFYQTDFDKIKKKYVGFKKYNKSICDFCGGEISSEHKQSHLSEMKTQMEELESKINSNQLQIKKYMDSARQSATKGKQASVEKERLIKEQKVYDENKNKVKRIQLMISNQNENLEKLKQEQQEIMKMKIVEVENKEWKDNEYKYELDNCNRTLNSNVTKIALIKNKIDAFNKNQKEKAKRWSRDKPRVQMIF
jgi:DNA repair exonuclease SbcCD ATPase subunit